MDKINNDIPAELFDFDRHNELTPSEVPTDTYTILIFDVKAWEIGPENPELENE